MSPISTSFYRCFQLSLVLATALLSACESFDVPHNGLEPVISGRSIYFGPGFSDEQRDLIRDDFKKIESLEIKAPKDGNYNAVFGSRSDAVLNYLERRSHYLLNGNLISEDSDTDSSSLKPNKKIAVNSGGSIWMAGVLSGQSMVVYIGDNMIPVRDSRIGMFTLYAYLDDDLKNLQVMRMQTMIHEARHSDCTGGLTEDDYNSFLEGDFSIGSKCLHGHVFCPSAHPLSGLPACDSRPWGAYTIGALFSLGVSDHCKNCDEKEKQLALMSGLDSLSRVIDLDPDKDLPRDELDLSSSTKMPANHPLAEPTEE